MTIEMFATSNDEDFVILSFIMNASILVNQGIKPFICQIIATFDMPRLKQFKKLWNLINPIPLPFSLYLIHGFCSESENVGGE